MRSEREVFRTGGGAEDLAGYARAVRTGSWVSVSGTAPASRGGVREQTLDAFRLALDAVEHFGGTIESVARTRVFLASGCDWQGAADAHRELFGEVTPANTTLFVAGFIPEGVLVEVEIDAVLHGGTSRFPP
jgi:enamine deaminase RidA (YjgF/YER057c/UK114 family)